LKIYQIEFLKVSLTNEQIIIKTGNVRITSYKEAFVKQLLQWKSNQYYRTWVFVCSLRYAAFKAHVPYCHLWPTPPYNIFLHFLINDTIFGGKKNYWTPNVCFDFL